MMNPEATSRHLKQVTELTLLAPIEQGFVPVPDVMSYASRLRLVLRALFELRRIAIERDLVETAGPLERLRSLYDVRWAIVDGDRKLLLAVTFDRSWESYIQGIVDEAAPLLDLIFSHCEGYEGHHCSDGYAAFASWVRARQAQCEFFYAGSPDVTVDDARYLSRFALSGEHAPLEEKLTDRGSVDSGYRVLAALYDLARWFPKRDASLWNALARVTIPRLDMLEPNGRPLDPDVAQWLLELKAPVPAPSYASEQQPRPHYEALRDAVQANILTYREGMTHGLVALLRCNDAEAMRGWLERVRQHVSAESAARDADLINLGFTYAGLRHFVGRAELQELPKEFREGMHARAGLLGDTGPINSPENWALPVRNWPADAPPGDRVALSSVDAVLIVQGKREGLAGDHAWSASHPLRGVLAELVGDAGVEVLHVQALRRKVEREHFGFTDNISQPAPVLAGLHLTAPPRDRVALGEILLGYGNARGFTERWPAASSGEDMFKDGSFLVLRKLEQDVPGYQTFVAQRAQLASEILGRDIQSGDPLVGPDGRSNEFDYSEDRAGARCPLFAHVRRANPRPSDPQLRERTPRILRRSFTYGSRYEDEPERDDRGLFFMAYNASIAQQYEVVQRWINGGNSSGGLSSQADLFCGTLPRSSGPYLVEGTSIQPPEAQLVDLCWGMYLFVPSLRVLARWASAPLAKQVPDAQQVARGKQIVRGLQALEAGHGEDAARAWKRVLEDLGTVEERAAVWTYLREDPRVGGVLDTPYGVLVATAGHAQTVLVDDGKVYSVCEYGERMQSSFGLKQHLGIDVHVPQYALQAHAPNAFVAAIDEDAAFEEARTIARQFLAARPDEAAVESSGPPRSPRPSVHVEAYASRVLGTLAHAWFGIPVDREVVQLLLTTSKFVFQPRPEPHLAELADEAGPELLSKFVAAATEPNPPAGSFLAKLQAGSPGVSAHGEAVLALVSGFYAATFGSFMAAIDSWIESGELWRLAPDRTVLKPALLAALRRRQGPTVIYRTARVSTHLGGVAIAAGTRVVVGIGSAANDDEPSQFDWLFGGAYTPGRGTQHACPAQPMALGVMVGLAAAILEQKELTRVRRFLLSYAR